MAALDDKTLDFDGDSNKDLVTKSTLTPTCPGEIDHEDSFVERWLLIPKILYFAMTLFVYSYSSTMGFFFKETMGFNNYQYGYASSLVVAAFFGSMIWSRLADMTGKYKTIIIFTSLMYSISVAALVVPVFDNNRSLRLIYNFIGFLAYNFFLSASFPLVDALIMGMLESKKTLNKEQFGFQRMFGCFGHLASTLISMGLYNGASTHKVWGLEMRGWFQIIMIVVISLLYSLVIFYLVPDIPPSNRLPSTNHHYDNIDDSNEKTKASDDLKSEISVKNKNMKILKSPGFLFFMLFVTVSGIVNSIIHNFQKIVAVCIWNQDKSLTSYIDIGRAVSEFSVYIFSRRLRSQFGVYWVLAFSQLTGILRLWGYGLVSTDDMLARPLSIILELVKGFNSGLLSSSAIIIASDLAPTGCESVAQGLYSGVYKGLSPAIGGVLSGIVLQLYYNQSGPLGGESGEILALQRTFSIFSATSLFFTIILCLKFIFVDRVMGVPGFPRRN